MDQSTIDYLIVPSAGQGSRMKSKTAKQFLELDGEPILVKTIKKFLHLFPELKVLIPLSEDGWEHFQALKRIHPVLAQSTPLLGGDTRYLSVKKAIELIENSSGITAVHDAARPLVNKETIINSFAMARNKGSALVCVACKDSIRKLEGETSRAVDRSLYKLVQTPQVFRTDWLKEAYNSVPYGPTITDDASVVEMSGKPIHLVEGSYSNIKITTPEDMDYAKAIIAAEKKAIVPYKDISS